MKKGKKKNTILHCPILEDLPPPPPDKSGWPWTVETQQVSDTTQLKGPLPKISIVTPSYNQGKFIEETIRSVLLQGYPNIEYLIIDGGSNDETTDIIKSYEPWIAYWISEKDRGQSNAINKGLRLAKGQIIGWINSDDIYLPNAFQKVAAYFPLDKSIGAICGFAAKLNCVEKKDDSIPLTSIISLDSLLRCNPIMQPSTFIKGSTLDKIGYLREEFHFIMDYEYWIRIALRMKLLRINEFLSAFRVHRESKSSNLVHIYLMESELLYRELSIKRVLEGPLLKGALREGVARIHAIKGQVSIDEGRVLYGIICYLRSLICRPLKLVEIRRALKFAKRMAQKGRAWKIFNFIGHNHCRIR